MRRDELTRANIALQNLDPKLQLLYEAARQNPEGCKWIGKAMEQWGAMIAEEAKLLAAVPEERPAAVQGFAGRACRSFGRIDNMG